jgi:hypothetical protein
MQLVSTENIGLPKLVIVSRLINQVENDIAFTRRE